jgi:hypothetical protein
VVRNDIVAPCLTQSAEPPSRDSTLEPKADAAIQQATEGMQMGQTKQLDPETMHGQETTGQPEESDQDTSEDDDVDEW